jgi:hypothetical protein
MRITPPIRRIVLIWAAWAIILLGFQTLVQERYQPDRPDYATEWTANETRRNSQDDKPYLVEPFMNNQVSWDSEFYLSIATAGYDDPIVRLVTTPQGDYAMNYAFFPLYPLIISVIRQPLLLLGLSPIGASVLGGVLISLVGTLAGMIALYSIAREHLRAPAAVFAAYSLLIFPSGFFLAQVYTEGLFIGLAFGCLALVRRRQWVLAGVLAALATWTRSVGVFLVLPLAWAWLSAWRAAGMPRGASLLTGAAILLPVAAYAIWQAAIGMPFDAVQTSWFGRQFLNVDQFLPGMERAITAIVRGENSAMRVYFIIEFASVALAALACALTARRYPMIALFSAIALIFAVTSGSPQSWVRYVLVIPSLHLLLARWSERESFERAWTLGSILLLAMQTTLFTYDMWVA